MGWIADPMLVKMLLSGIAIAVGLTVAAMARLQHGELPIGRPYEDPRDGFRRRLTDALAREQATLNELHLSREADAAKSCHS